MKAIEELKPIDLGEGSSMRLFIDKDKPTDSIHRRWTETAYDGTGSKPFVVPLHWHKYHDEHLLVKEGRLEMTVGNNTFVADPSTGTMIAPRNTVHGIKFFKGVKTILEEKTNPVGEFKEECVPCVILSSLCTMYWSMNSLNCEKVFSGPTRFQSGTS